MALIWERGGGAYYAAVTGSDGDVLVRLIVEPRGVRWDWAVWRAGEALDKARQGISGTVQEAMREAERAVNTIS